MPASYTSARFVGREVAFARLAAVLDDAASGRSRTLILGGTAGIGISRFLDEGVTRVAELTEPWTILRSGSWPCGADDPYAPVVRAIGPALRALDDAALETVLGPAALEVVRLLPDLAIRLGEPTEGVASAPERRQARTLEAVLGMLGRLGERRPVALILEDLHRADAATRALVRFLSRIARDQRLAIIASDQPDIVPRDDPWSSDLAAIAAAPRPLERLTLAPLDRDDLAALIEGIEGERASASLLLLVVERSGGLPLVAEELLAARRELPSASLSGTLDALVVARLSARSPECRDRERELGEVALAGGARLEVIERRADGGPALTPLDERLEDAAMGPAGVGEPGHEPPASSASASMIRGASPQAPPNRRSSLRRTRRSRSAWWMRLLTVPSGRFSASAVSWSDCPSR